VREVAGAADDLQGAVWEPLGRGCGLADGYDEVAGAPDQEGRRGEPGEMTGQDVPLTARSDLFAERGQRGGQESGLAGQPVLLGEPGWGTRAGLANNRGTRSSIRWAAPIRVRPQRIAASPTPQAN
jgi:hypothetical protein